MFAMRSLLPLQIAVAIALCAWLWIKYTAVDPLPDWRTGELVIIVPPAEIYLVEAFPLTAPGAALTCYVLARPIKRWMSC